MIILNIELNYNETNAKDQRKLNEKKGRALGNDYIRNEPSIHFAGYSVHPFYRLH